MILYFLRHAEAVELTDTLQDEWRYLTEKGRSSAEKISNHIAKYGPKPRLTITSPLTRAVQTAEIVAKKACRKNVVISSPLLLPDADPCAVIDYLKQCKDSKRVLVVGHEPQLGELVARILNLNIISIPMKKASCIALEFDPYTENKPARFCWYLTPGKKRVSSIKKLLPPQTEEINATTFVTEG